MTDATKHRKSKNMRRSTIIIATIAIIVLTIAIALIAAENAQYTQPITIKNGVAYAQTANGEMTLDSIHENDVQIVAQRISGYNAPKNVPATLPNTSAPHGTHTCDFGTYQVTTDQACEDLQ